MRVRHEPPLRPVAGRLRNWPFHAHRLPNSRGASLQKHQDRAREPPGETVVRVDSSWQYLVPGARRRANPGRRHRVLPACSRATTQAVVQKVIVVVLLSVWALPLVRPYSELGRLALSVALVRDDAPEPSGERYRSTPCSRRLGEAERAWLWSARLAANARATTVRTASGLLVVVTLVLALETSPPAQTGARARG
jgi:hypothetical protein